MYKESVTSESVTIFNFIIMDFKISNGKNEMKLENNPKVERNSTGWFDGFKPCKYAGTIYDKSGISLFHVIRFSSIHILSILHFGLLILLEYNTIGLLIIVENMHYIMMHISGLCMGIALLCNSKKFITYCTLINTELMQQEIKLPKMQEVYRKNNIFFKSFMKMSTSMFIWGFIATFFRRPLFDRKSHMTVPHEGWVPFEINTWPRYFAVCAFQFAVGLNLASGHLATVLSYVIHAKHLCGQFEILSILIQDTFEDDLNSENKKIEENIPKREIFIKSRMTYIVQRHHLLLKCFDLFQNLYSAFLFTLSLTSGVMFCTLIYMITDPKSSSFLITEFVTLLFSEMIVIGCYCWFGQEMSDWWDHIREVVYNIPWYEESIKTQKSLLNILTGSTKDKTIMAGGLQEFTVKGFSEMVQASFSYFNMLKAVR